MATMEDLVEGRGYPLEKHTVNSDGYLLSLYRIPHGIRGGSAAAATATQRPVVMLQHGISLSSVGFVTLGPGFGLGFILADAGFDVWLPNTRGDSFARQHVTLSPAENAFWEFSMDELALQDLPAQIDFALNATGAAKLGVLGHSQGATLIPMLLSAKPEYNKKVAVAVLMGSVVFPEFIKPQLLKTAMQSPIDEIYTTLGVGDAAPWASTYALYSTFCGTGFLGPSATCFLSLLKSAAGNASYIDATDVPLIASTYPSSVSVRNGIHWLQMFRDGIYRLQRYDFGDACVSAARAADPFSQAMRRPLLPFLPPFFKAEAATADATDGAPSTAADGNATEALVPDSCNRAAYGTETPPEYNLAVVSAPVVYVSGELDQVATAQDVAEQKRRLRPGVVVGSLVAKGYGHMDMIWGSATEHSTYVRDVFRNHVKG